MSFTRCSKVGIGEFVARAWSPATPPSATAPGIRSSARCASRTGGRATPNTTRRLQRAGLRAGAPPESRRVCGHRRSRPADDHRHQEAGSKTSSWSSPMWRRSTSPTRPRPRRACPAGRAARLRIQHGAEPVMQIAARDRTRTGLQAEVLGANALGVRNILCLSGDSMKMAPEPARPHGHVGHRLGPDAVDPAPDARRRQLPGRALDEIPAQVISWARPLALCLRAALPGHPRAQEGQRRSAVLPDQPGLRPRRAGDLAERAGQAQYPG